jgi:protein gp37
MGQDSAIEWTDHTFNPWWGCTRVSPACQHCYAETLAHRFGTEWGKNADRRFFGDKHWNEPRRWDRAAAKAGVRRRVFCASMADVFEDRPELAEHRERLWRLVADTPHLDWLLLTKRPENVLSMTPWAWRVGEHSDPPHHEDPIHWPRNAWVGTTVEDQEHADERIPHLLAVPAPVRFLSCEPLLGPIWLRLGVGMRHEGIGWVIAGGESGPGARPMQLEWATDLRDQATGAGVPFLFKQWGEWRPIEGDEADELNPHGLIRVGKKEAGRQLGGRTWDELPILASRDR